MNYPALLSFICGFASLSLEILWVRLYGFANFSTPFAFGFVLTAYLAGIALGAHVGSRVCRRNSSDHLLWSYSMAALLLSAMLSIGLPRLMGWMVSNGAENFLSAFLVIACASSILAFVFPVAHHLGANHHLGRQGQRFALVYTSNVLGAALGPLVTGYVLLDFLSLQQSYLAICLVQLTAVLVFVLMMADIPKRRILAGASLAMALGVLWTSHDADPHGLIQQLNQRGEHAKTVIENRHGVITLFKGTAGSDAVYGGNVYDGQTNLNPQRNTNGLDRTLLLSVLQPQPKRVLMIGLSIGTWLALVNEFPGVEKVDVIEINPGYFVAAQDYPAQRKALLDPRVNVFVDDARRWLRLHKENKYDMVIMNTTWHWRSNASLLLSTEFLQLIKQHMAPSALMSFNSTGSGDAFFTASKVYAHAYRYSNFVYAADFDFRNRKDTALARDVYSRLQLNGQPLFEPNSIFVEKFLTEPFVTIEEAQYISNRPFEKITDQNMITEFKYGRPLY